MPSPPEGCGGCSRHSSSGRARVVSALVATLWDTAASMAAVGRFTMCHPCRSMGDDPTTSCPPLEGFDCPPILGIRRIVLNRTSEGGTKWFGTIEVLWGLLVNAAQYSWSRQNGYVGRHQLTVSLHLECKGTRRFDASSCKADGRL